jgi:hypothetical protein
MKDITLRELKIKAKELGYIIYTISKKRSVKNNWYGYSIIYAKLLNDTTVNSLKKIEIEGNKSDILYHFTY